MATNNKNIGIKGLPSKTNLRDSDVLIIQDSIATYNTTIGNIRKSISSGLADNITIEDNKLYLMSNGKKIGDGITITNDGDVIPDEVYKWNEF